MWPPRTGTGDVEASLQVSGDGVEGGGNWHDNRGAGRLPKIDSVASTTATRGASAPTRDRGSSSTYTGIGKSRTRYTTSHLRRCPEMIGREERDLLNCSESVFLWTEKARSWPGVDSESSRRKDWLSGRDFFYSDVVSNLSISFGSHGIRLWTAEYNDRAMS